MHLLITVRTLKLGSQLKLDKIQAPQEGKMLLNRETEISLKTKIIIHQQETGLFQIKIIQMLQEAELPLRRETEPSPKIQETAAEAAVLRLALTMNTAER